MWVFQVDESRKRRLEQRIAQLREWRKIYSDLKLEVPGPVDR